jgi:hypothetical protein
VQKDDGWEGAYSLRPAKVALDRLALTGARETRQLVSFGGSAAREEPE